MDCDEDVNTCAEPSLCWWWSGHLSYVHQENAHRRPRGNVPHSLVGAGYTKQLALEELCRLVRC
jgi:hypothetical protein